MQQSNASPSRTRKCIVCGIEKPLNEDYFQPVRSFLSGFSFYCNICDMESRSHKIPAPRVVLPRPADGDKSDLSEADSTD